MSSKKRFIICCNYMSPAPMTHTSARRTFPLFRTTSFSCVTGKTKLYELMMILKGPEKRFFNQLLTMSKQKTQFLAKVRVVLVISHEKLQDLCFCPYFSKLERSGVTCFGASICVQNDTLFTIQCNRFSLHHFI